MAGQPNGPSSEATRPHRWLIAAYVLSLVLSPVMALMRLHEGFRLVAVLFGLPLILIGVYLVLSIRRAFRPDWMALLTNRNLFLVFVMPVLLYLAIVAGGFTRLMLAFVLSFL